MHFGRTALFEQRSFFDPIEPDLGKERHKLLMPLPDSSRLIINGCEVAQVSRYLMDSQGNVYAYLEELGAAVESENVYACDENGASLSFSAQDAKHLQVLSYESAMEQLYP